MIYFLTTRISAQVGSRKPGTTGQLTAAVQVGSIYTIMFFTGLSFRCYPFIINERQNEIRGADAHGIHIILTKTLEHHFTIINLEPGLNVTHASIPLEAAAFVACCC
jgi:hypothetical protein